VCTDLIEDLEGDRVDHVLDDDPEHGVWSALRLVGSTSGQSLRGLQRRLRGRVLKHGTLNYIFRQLQTKLSRGGIK